MYLSPKPTEKLSKLTEKAKNNIPIKLRFLILGFSSKKCVNISIDNNKNTKNNTILGLIIVYEKSVVPIILPNNGIKK